MSAAQVLVDELAFDGSWIGLVNPADQTLEGRAWAGGLASASFKDLHIPLTGSSQDPALTAISEERTLIFTPDGPPRPPPSEYHVPCSDFRYQVYVPIKERESTDGIIIAVRDREDPITAADVQVLEASAQQLAIILRNVRLLERVQREARRWEGVALACEAVHRSVSLSDILEAIAHGIVQALRFHMVVINVRKNDTFEVTTVIAPPEAKEKLLGQQVPWAEFAELMREEYRISRSYFISHDRIDWHKTSLWDRAYRPNLPERGPGHWHPEDMLLIPMYHEGELIGILSVDDPEDGLVPDLNTIQTLEVLANQAAMAISRAKLFSELQARNQELDAFSYSVTHDLKTPLTTVRGYAEALTLMYGKQLGPEGLEMAERIQEGADRMATIIDDLLMLARANKLSGPMEEINVNYVIGAVLERFREAILERNVQIEVAPNLPPVCGQTTWIEQVFANLIDNAIKYAGRDNKSPRIVIDGRQEGEKTHLRVQDNGLGFTEEQRDQLFKMFTRFHEREAPGTGLGLAIAQRAIHRMGGKIWAESPGPGQGSTFHILLPTRCKEEMQDPPFILTHLEGGDIHAQDDAS
ncbi:MAG TPA: GAF domain-containing protein [Caldilineae bacterium]|nr:GAF domain-containing protein [Caldilineae bacterium]